MKTSIVISKECPPVEVTANVVNTLNEIVNTGIVTPENPNITAPDGTVVIKNSGLAIISTQNVKSGSSQNYIVANSVVVLQDSASAMIDSFNVPATSGITRTIGDSVVTLKDSGGANISITNVKATEAKNITAPDGAITVNGSSIGGVKSNGTRALLVKLDGTNSGVYDGVNTINVTSPTPTVKGAQQLKTFQTTSYATGDDGNGQQGRGTSHLLLGWTNKFGNNNRFTDFVGGTTYANNIVLDHQQDNGTSIMCYYKSSLALSNDSWANNITYCNALNVAGFTGWRMANIRQLEVLANYELTNILDFSPFNAGGVNAHSSTTYKPSTTLCHGLNGSYISVIGKGATTAKCLPCRRFTYAELGL